MGRGSSLRTLRNIGWLQKKGERRPAPPGSGIRHFRSNTCTGGRERGAAAASGEYHLSSFGASSAKRDFPHSLVPPPSLRIQPAWREGAECVTDYTAKRHRKATYSFPLSEKKPTVAQPPFPPLQAPGSVFGKAEVRRRRKDEEGGRLEREEGAAAAADGGDEKSGPRSQGGGMREWIGGRRRAGMQDQGFRGSSLERRRRRT